MIVVRRQVERYWNGAWGRLARRDVWLWEQDGRWTVEICAGGLDEGRRHEWVYESEATARAQLIRCLTAGEDSWVELRSGRS